MEVPAEIAKDSDLIDDWKIMSKYPGLFKALHETNSQTPERDLVFDRYKVPEDFAHRIRLGEAHFMLRRVGIVNV